MPFYHDAFAYRIQQHRGEAYGRVLERSQGKMNHVHQYNFRFRSVARTGLSRLQRQKVASPLRTLSRTVACRSTNVLRNHHQDRNSNGPCVDFRSGSAGRARGGSQCLQNNESSQRAGVFIPTHDAKSKRGYDVQERGRRGKKVSFAVTSQNDSDTYQEESSCDGMNRCISPSLVEETSSFVQIIKVG